MNLWVCVVVLSGGVSFLNEIPDVLREEFMSVPDFAFGYVMFVCFQYDVGENGVSSVYVVWYVYVL